MDIRRSQEVDTAACHALMMRKQEELMQRLHKAEEALQHSVRDSILCGHPPLACLACAKSAYYLGIFLAPLMFADPIPKRSAAEGKTAILSRLRFTCIPTSKAAGRGYVIGKSFPRSRHTPGVLCTLPACELPKAPPL